MPSAAKQAGSTADLPPEDAIAAGEESREDDIDALFGMSTDDDNGVAASGEGATSSPAAAGAAGASAVDGQSGAPALPSDGGTPPSSPSGEAVPPQSATGGDGSSTPPQGQQGGQPSQPPAPGAATPPAAPSDEALRVASLEATVQALQQELANARANPASMGQPQAGPQSQPGQQDDLPRYALTLPQQVAAAINSGDDQQTVAGITHMMNSLATIVHHNVRQEMRASFGQLMQLARAQEETGAATQAIEASRADYYSAFPDHNNPLILPIIQAESVAMAGQFPGLPWNEQYRNALGQRVNARLAELRGQQQAPSNVPPAPAGMLPAGSRPAEMSGAELAGGDLIADTFS